MRAENLDLVVVCRSDGVRIHPSGQRLSGSKLDDRQIVNALRGVVRNRQQAEPNVQWQPRVKFLVEPGGNAVYWEARRQTAMSGLGWPVWLEVAEGTIPGRLFDPEVLR